MLVGRQEGGGSFAGMSIWSDRTLVTNRESASTPFYILPQFLPRAKLSEVWPTCSALGGVSSYTFWSFQAVVLICCWEPACVSRQLWLVGFAPLCRPRLYCRVFRTKHNAPPRPVRTGSTPHCRPRPHCRVFRAIPITFPDPFQHVLWPFSYVVRGPRSGDHNHILLRVPHLA